ncbi:MAG: hypothetical protein RL219_1564 [Actinomycetota bacterium]
MIKALRARHGLAALLVATALVAAGCSSSDSDSGSNTSAAPDSTAPGTTDGGSPTGAGDFGDLAEVCGPGSASGSTDQGVTDNQIVVGTMSDPGNSIVPGLNQELFDAADAFVGWCNEAGGILGRQIVLNKRDAKLLEAGPRMVEACQSDFMLVGNGVALDDTVVEARTGCGLTEIVAFTVSPRAGRAEGSIAANVNSDWMSHLTGIYRRIKALDPEVVGFYGMLNNQNPALNTQGKRNAQAAVDLGFTQVFYDETPLAVDNWRTYAENIKKAGVQVLSTQNTPENTAALMRAMADVGYFPKYLVMEANHYNNKFLEEAGDTVGQTTVLINSYLTPFEQASSNPATQQFVDLVEQYADTEPKAIGVNAFSAWLLWSTAAKACGSELTRACVMQRATGVTGWTGGGLHAPDTPQGAAGPNSPCFVAIRATGDGFVIDTETTAADTGIYNCEPANAVQVTGYNP